MLNIFQNLTASSLYIDFNDPTDLSKVLRRNNISLCQTQVAACYQNGAHKNQGNDERMAYAESSTNRVPWPATSKRKSRTTAIFDRTLEHSPRACTHMYARKSHTNNIFFGAVKIASHRNFLRITFNFASQNFDFASQTAMRYRINSSLYYEYQHCRYKYQLRLSCYDIAWSVHGPHLAMTENTESADSSVPFFVDSSAQQRNEAVPGTNKE